MPKVHLVIDRECLNHQDPARAAFIAAGYEGVLPSSVFLRYAVPDDAGYFPAFMQTPADLRSWIHAHELGENPGPAEFLIDLPDDAPKVENA